MGGGVWLCVSLYQRLGGSQDHPLSLRAKLHKKGLYASPGVLTECSRSMTYQVDACAGVGNPMPKVEVAGSICVAMTIRWSTAGSQSG